jgi:hypothetical protein
MASKPLKTNAAAKSTISRPNDFKDLRPVVRSLFLSFGEGFLSFPRESAQPAC